LVSAQLSLVNFAKLCPRRELNLRPTA